MQVFCCNTVEAAESEDICEVAPTGVGLTSVDHGNNFFSQHHREGVAEQLHRRRGEWNDAGYVDQSGCGPDRITEVHINPDGQPGGSKMGDHLDPNPVVVVVVADRLRCDSRWIKCDSVTCIKGCDRGDALPDRLYVISDPRGLQVDVAGGSA